MKTIASFLLALHKDEDGASFIEYTALLGVILAVGIGILAAVGTWAGDVWDTLCTTLGTESGIPCTT
jgi:Flp pilus assembly pilin Flp